MARSDQTPVYVNPHGLRPVIVTAPALALICCSILIAGCMVSGAILLVGAPPEDLPPMRLVMLVTPTPMSNDQVSMTNEPLSPTLPPQAGEGRLASPTETPTATKTYTPTVPATNTLSASWAEATLTAQVTATDTPSRLPESMADKPLPPQAGEGSIASSTANGIFQTATALAVASPTPEVKVGYHQARVAVELGLYTYWCFPATLECRAAEIYWLSYGEGDTFVTLADEDFCRWDSDRLTWFFQSNVGTWFAWKDSLHLYSEPAADVEEACQP